MTTGPIMNGGCCPKSDDSVTQVRLDESRHTVGIRGLETVFEQLLAMGCAPTSVTDAELLTMVRAARNYIPSRQEVEARYATALRREFAAFYARRAGRDG